MCPLLARLDCEVATLCQICATELRFPPQGSNRRSIQRPASASAHRGASSPRTTPPKRPPSTSSRARADSGLPSGKSLAEFDFAAVPAVSKAHVMALAEADSWIGQGHNLLAFGPPGTGKTHLLAGIGHALIDRGLKVLFMRTRELVQRLQAARRDLRLPAELAKLIASTSSSWTTSAMPGATRPRRRYCSS